MKGIFMTKIKPLRDRVLIQRVEANEKTAGGIVLPDTAKEKPKRGKVIAAGPGKMLENGTRNKMQIRKGDEVLFGSYAGTDITIDGKEMLIVSEDDILAVVT